MITKGPERFYHTTAHLAFHYTIRYWDCELLSLLRVIEKDSTSTRYHENCSSKRYGDGRGGHQFLSLGHGGKETRSTATTRAAPNEWTPNAQVRTTCRYIWGCLCLSCNAVVSKDPQKYPSSHFSHQISFSLSLQATNHRRKLRTTPLLI